jgi:hypothetical protein
MGIIDAALTRSSCSNCVYWHETEEVPSYGRCKRRSPLPDMQTDFGGSVWPMTPEADWCGEHERA